MQSGRFSIGADPGIGLNRAILQLEGASSGPVSRHVPAAGCSATRFTKRSCNRAEHAKFYGFPQDELTTDRQRCSLWCLPTSHHAVKVGNFALTLLSGLRRAQIFLPLRNAWRNATDAQLSLVTRTKGLVDFADLIAKNSPASLSTPSRTHYRAWRQQLLEFSQVGKSR